MSRARLLGLAGLVVLAGLALRLPPWGLPLRVHHTGGGLLWGMMLYLLAAAMRRPGWGQGACLVVAGLVALGVETSRLLSSPGLDAFRATLPGQLLLGRIFSAWNLVAYGIGIGIAAWLSGRPLDSGGPARDPSHPEAPLGGSREKRV